MIDDSFAVLTLVSLVTEEPYCSRLLDNNGGYTNLFWWFLNNGLLFQNQTIKNLEARVQQLMVEAENSNLQRQKLSQEKTEAEQCYQAACSELQEMKAR